MSNISWHIKHIIKVMVDIIIIIKGYSECLFYYLLIIFNKLVKSGINPNKFKLTTVTPIVKNILLFIL